MDETTRTSQKTRLCGPDATWRDWHWALIGRPCLPATRATQAACGGRSYPAIPIEKIAWPNAFCWCLHRDSKQRVSPVLCTIATSEILYLFSGQRQPMPQQSQPVWRNSKNCFDLTTPCEILKRPFLRHHHGKTNPNPAQPSHSPVSTGSFSLHHSLQ